MIDLAFAERFSADWLEAWNRHDLTAILAHYHDDIVFHSPRIRGVTGRDVDSVRGRADLERYWAKALVGAPDLKFELKTLLIGSDALTIMYKNHRGQLVAETFVFDPEGRVLESLATYGQ